MKLSQKQTDDIAQTLDMGLVCYIHKETGEVKEMQTEESAEIGGVEKEWREEMEVIEKERDKWVLIEPMLSRDSFRIMSDFAEMEVRNRNLQGRLAEALNRSRPFANFKRIVDNSDMREEWFAFKRKRYEAWVRREIRGDFEFDIEDTNEGMAVSETGLTEAEMNEIITNEIVVDAKDADDVAMGWLYYMQAELLFPFEAKMEVKNRNEEKSVVRIDVLDLSPDNENNNSPEVILEVSEKGSERVMDVRISKLQDVKADESTKNAVAIWKYWKSGKFRFV